MKAVLSLLLVSLLIFAGDATRRRRQYGASGYSRQYGSQYGLYGPGGQGWANNNNMYNQYPNQQGYGWNSNSNWNQGNRRPEWYYNHAKSVRSSVLCFLPLVFYRLVI